VIAEDNFVLRRVVVDYLATFGISCVEAESEAETWLALKTCSVDVLVLDLILSSDKPMFSIIRRMQKDPTLRDIPIIVTSAYSRESLRTADREGCLAVCSFLQKPYDLSQLRCAIIKAIGGSRKTMTPCVG
jgi:CheY-like chemotaxis protein